MYLVNEIFLCKEKFLTLLALPVQSKFLCWSAPGEGAILGHIPTGLSFLSCLSQHHLWELTEACDSSKPLVRAGWACQTQKGQGAIHFALSVVVDKTFSQMNRSKLKVYSMAQLWKPMLLGRNPTRAHEQRADNEHINSCTFQFPEAPLRIKNQFL